MVGRLQGKTALVTAAGQGIGRAAALMMAAERVTEELARADDRLFGEGGAEPLLADALAALERGLNRAHDVVHAARLAIRLRGAREMEELVQDAVQPVELLREDVEKLALGDLAVDISGLWNTGIQIVLHEHA